MYPFGISVVKLQFIFDDYIYIISISIGKSLLMIFQTFIFPYFNHKLLKCDVTTDNTILSVSLPNN